MSRFAEGETVLLKRWRFRGFSSLSYPSYRINFQCPPLVWTTLYVTDRRVRLICRLSLVVVQEMDFWYPGTRPDADEETITRVGVERNKWGEHLEIRSRDPKRSAWKLASPDLWLQFYFKNPARDLEVLQNAIDRTGGLPAPDPNAPDDKNMTPKAALGLKIPLVYALVAVLSLLGGVAAMIAGAEFAPNLLVKILCYVAWGLLVFVILPWSLIAGMIAGRKKADSK